MKETFDNIHDWYYDHQLLASHLPLGVQIELAITAYELETGQISRRDAVYKAVYLGTVAAAHTITSVIAVQHMIRVQGVYADIPASLAKRIEKIAFGSSLRMASRLMAPLTIYEMYQLGRDIFTPGATSYTRRHYGGVRSFHAIPRLYL